MNLSNSSIRTQLLRRVLTISREWTLIIFSSVSWLSVKWSSRAKFHKFKTESLWLSQLAAWFFLPLSRILRKFSKTKRNGLVFWYSSTSTFVKDVSTQFFSSTIGRKLSTSLRTSREEKLKSWALSKTQCLLIRKLRWKLARKAMKTLSSKSVSRKWESGT